MLPEQVQEAQPRVVDLERGPQPPTLQTRRAGFRHRAFLVASRHGPVMAYVTYRLGALHVVQRVAYSHRACNLFTYNVQR